MKLLGLHKWSLDHNGGTKSYHMAAIACAETGKSILMKRWGKTGQFGQVQVVTFTTADGAHKEALKIYREKQRKGYAEIDHKATRSDVDAPHQFFGPAVWAEFGGDNLDHLGADINTSGFKRSPTAPRKDEDGNFVPPSKPRMVEPSEEDIARERLEKAKTLNADNPLFGMF